LDSIIQQPWLLLPSNFSKSLLLAGIITMATKHYKLTIISKVRMTSLPVWVRRVSLFHFSAFVPKGAGKELYSYVVHDFSGATPVISPENKIRQVLRGIAA
jgi:hypothetical protein